MTQIFVLVVVALLLAVSGVVFGTAYNGSGSSAEGLDSIVSLLATGQDAGAVVPVVLMIALAVSVIGVWGRLA